MFEFTDNLSITNLFGNLCDRIDFLLPNFHEKEHLKLIGKMYRAKLTSKEGKFNSICSLQNTLKSTDSANYLINGKDILKADSLLDSIIEKLNLMYSVRQSYSLEGLIWKSKELKVLVKCLTIYSGSEAVNILIQVENDEILQKVFPDFDQESKIKLIKLEVEIDEELKNYLEIIVKTVKLYL